MRISVITPSYNSVKYLDRAIASVLSQNYECWEHIIVDGGSTDGTIDILNKHKHLKWICEKDKGQSDAMNKGFELSTGDIIVYLNADDFFEKNVFAEVIKMFSSSTADMVVGKLNRINSRNVVFDVHQPSILLNEILDVTKLRFPLNPVCYFYRRTLQTTIGSFPVENHFTMDYWFLLRAYLISKIIYIDKVLGNFHMHGSNKTAGYFSTKKSQFDVLVEFGKLYDIDCSPYLRNFLDGILTRYKASVDLVNQYSTITNTKWYKVGNKLRLFPKSKIK